MSSPRPHLRRRGAERGVTLLELMVSVALLTVVLASVITAFLSQNRLFGEMGSQRATQGNARMALGTIQRYLARTGYGIHPSLALDPSWYCPACVRDSTTGPDQIVFMARNPRYYADPQGTALLGNAWLVQSGSSGGPDATLALRGGDTIRMGEVLEIVCPGGYTYGYVTAAAQASVPAGGGTVNTDVTMQADNGDPYHHNAVLGSKCVAAGRARAFAVDRFHFLVQADNADPTHPNRPFLYLDRGMDMNSDGAINQNDYQVVAADIEDLQFAYLMNDGNTLGDAASPGVPVAPNNGGNPCSNQISDPFYQALNLAACPVGDGRRVGGGINGNVRAVRVTVVARSLQKRRLSNTSVNTSGTPQGSVEDHIVSPPVYDGYQREVLSTTVQLPNLDSRGVPIL